MPRRPEKTQPVVVKRSANERKKLPPELEAFARSQDEKLRVSRPRVDRGKVNDPREGYTIAGVANRDGRAVYDGRSEAMRALWADGKASEAALAELGQLLHDAQRLVLWRARRLTGFDAFAEEVVGVPAKRAQELVDAHTAQSGEAPTELSERNVAAWLRTEAGAYEGDERARARISSTPDGLKLVLTVSLSGASLALAGVGNRHAPLAREQDGGLSDTPAPRRAAAPAAEHEARGPARESPVEASPERLPAGSRLLTRKRSEDVSAEGGAPADEVAGQALAERAARFERPTSRAHEEPRASTFGSRAEPRASTSRDRQAAPRDRSEKRPAFAEKRSFGDKPRGEPRSFGARAGRAETGGEQRSSGNKPSYADKRGFDAQRGSGEKRSFGAKPASGDKPAFRSSRPEPRAATGDKRGAGAKGSFGEKRPFGAGGADKRSFGNAAGGGFKRAAGGGGFKGGAGGGFQRAGAGGQGGGVKRPFDKRPAAGGKGFVAKGAAGGKKAGGFARPAGKGARPDDAGDE